MAAANTDKFKKLTNNFSTTLSGAIVGASDTSMSLSSTTNLPTDTGAVFVIDRVNSSGVATPTVREYVVGTVSGSNVTNLVRGVGNSTAQAHSTGAVVEQVVDQRTINDLMDGILTQHNQDGTHAAVTATSVNASGAVTSGGLLTASNAFTLTTGTLTLPSASINQTALPLGAAVQQVSATFNAVATGTTILPIDDTIPQNTEGDQYMTLAITPKATTNILVIQVVGTFACSSTGTVTAALFQDATANALAADGYYSATGNGVFVLPLTHKMAAGTTSATTFKLRAGPGAAGTLTFNGAAGGRLWGGIVNSSITITEYKA